VNNAAILLQLIIQAGDAIARYSKVLMKAANEGRDVTDEEVTAASADAQAELDSARAKIRG